MGTQPSVPVSTKQSLRVSETISVFFLTVAASAAGLATFLSILFTRPVSPEPPQTLVNPICNPYNTYANGQWYEGTQHVHLRNDNWLQVNGDISTAIYDNKVLRGLKWAMIGMYIHGIAQNGQYYPPGGVCPPGENCNYGRTCPYGAGSDRCQGTRVPTNNPAVDWIYDWNGDNVFHWEHPTTRRWYSYDEAPGAGINRDSMQETIFLQYEKTAAGQGLTWLPASVDLKRADDDPNFIPINWVEGGNGPHVNVTAYETPARSYDGRDVWRFDPAHFPGDPNFPFEYYNGAYRTTDPNSEYQLMGTRASPAPQYCRSYGENKWVYDRNGLAVLAHMQVDHLGSNSCIERQLDYTFGGAFVAHGKSLKYCSPSDPECLNPTWREEVWDRYLRAGYKHFWGWGEFDHCIEGADADCVGTDFVYTNNFTRQGVIDALKKGSFYVSTGHPTSEGYTNILNVSVDQANQTIALRVHNADRVTWFGPGQGRNDPIDENDNPHIERDTGSVGTDWTASFTFNAATLAAIQQYAQQNNKPYTTPFIRAVVERSDAQQHSNLGPIAAYTQPFFYDAAGCTDTIPGEEPPPPPPCPEGQVNQGQVCTCSGRPAGNPAGFCCSGNWQTTICQPVNPPPTITLAAPQEGNELAGTFDVRAVDITDDGAVSRVEFILSGEAVHVVENPGSTVTWQWDTRGEVNGTYSFNARAVDDEGAETTTPEIQISIENPDDILFGDNFDDGDAIGWVTQTSWVVAEDGESSPYYRTNFPGAGVTTADEQSFPSVPFSVSVRVRKALDAGSTSLRGFVRGTSGYELVYNATTEKLDLYLLLNNTSQLIQEVPASLDLRQWHVLELQFSAVNGVIGTIRRDGITTPIATVRSTNLYPLPAGSIGLSCNNNSNAGNHCRFDDVLVRSLPPEQTPPPSGTIFSDDFQDSNADGWSTENGVWSVQNNEYRSAPQGTADWSTRTAWVDGRTFDADEFSVLTKVKYETVGTTTDRIGVMAARSSSTNNYRFFYSMAEDVLYLTESGTVRQSVSLPNLDLTQPHWMKLTLRKSGTSLVLEGRMWPETGQVPTTPQITWTDTAPLLSIGSAGLTCRQASGIVTTVCRFDDFSVQTPGGTTPGGGSPVFLKASPVFLKIEVDIPAGTEN